MATDWIEEAKKNGRIYPATLPQREFVPLDDGEQKKCSTLAVLVYCYLFMAVCSIFSGAGLILIPITYFFLLPVLIISFCIDVYKAIKTPYLPFTHSLQQLFFSWKTFWIVAILLIPSTSPFFFLPFLACYIICWMIFELKNKKKEVPVYVKSVAVTSTHDYKKTKKEQSEWAKRHPITRLLFVIFIYFISPFLSYIFLFVIVFSFRFFQKYPIMFFLSITLLLCALFYRIYKYFFKNRKTKHQRYTSDDIIKGKHLKDVNLTDD